MGRSWTGVVTRSGGRSTQIKYLSKSTDTYAVVGDMDGVKSVSVSVKEGDPVTLNPDAEIHKDALMLWMFVEKGILLAKLDIETNKISLYNDNERFRDRLKLNHQTGSLTIKNTRITDSGLYELQIRGSEHLQRFFVSVSALPDPGLSPGAIAGISLVVIVLVLLLVGALLYYRQRVSILKSQMCEDQKPVMEGESVTLCTGLTVIQRDETIEWWYEDEDRLIAKINGDKREIFDVADGRFRSKLSLNAKGDLTISNSRTIHSGLYKLKISSNRSYRGSITRKPIYKRFSFTITVKSVTVQEGESVRFQTEAQIQRGDLILWTFGASNLLVIRDELTGTESIHKDFRDRLELDHQTGSLKITNTRTTDSGHFKLQIINHQKTTFGRFDVTVTASTGNQESEPVTVMMRLLSEDDADGENQQQETSSL